MRIPIEQASEDHVHTLVLNTLRRQRIERAIEDDYAVTMLVLGLVPDLHRWCSEGRPGLLVKFLALLA